MSVELDGNILVTGTNRGIGLDLVKMLAERTGQRSHIYACCREPEGSRAEVRHKHTHTQKTLHFKHNQFSSSRP